MEADTSPASLEMTTPTASPTSAPQHNAKQYRASFFFLFFFFNTELLNPGKTNKQTKRWLIFKQLSIGKIYYTATET